MTTQTHEQELETLRAHSAELLADLRKAKATIKELTEQLEATTSERDAAKQAWRDLTLERPVQAMLEQVAILPDYFMAEFNARGYRFELDDDSEVIIVDGDGNPAQVGESRRVSGELKPEITMRPATFTEADIRKLALEDWLPEEERSPHVERFTKLMLGSRASGGGAGGARGTRQAPQIPANEAKPAKLSTGLR